MTEILISFLSGAIGGALVTGLFNLFSEKYNRKITYLRNQIDYFYGPLYFILTNSESLLEISKKIVDAGQEVYDKPDIRKTEAGEKRLPLQVRKIMGEISILQVHFKNKIMEKFNYKKTQLSEPIFLCSLKKAKDHT
jgi:hypothetical protein